MVDDIDTLLVGFGFMPSIEYASCADAMDVYVEYCIEDLMPSDVGIPRPKPNAKPMHFKVSYEKFKTLEELLVWIDLNIRSGTEIVLHDVDNAMASEIERRLNYGRSKIQALADC